MSNIQAQKGIKCDVCKKISCKDEIHKYVTRHNMYYDKDSKLKISKSGLNKLNNNAK
jgi:hypothetical protein